MGSHANASTSTTPLFKSKNQTFLRTLSSPATAISAHGIQRHELFFSFLSTSSAKPLFGQRKSERAAVGRRADGRVGNRAAIPQLAAALKKEPKSDVRASIVAGL